MNSAASDLPQATDREPRGRGLHLVSVAWGEWYRTALTDLLLPTLMSAGNIPALKDVLPARFTIHTTRHDCTQIRNSAIFPSLAESIPLDIQIHDRFEQSISTHHAIWARTAKAARGLEEHIFFMPPDLVCADGALRHLAKLIADGKRAIYCTAPRIASETFRDAIRDIFRPDQTGAIKAQPRPLLRLMLEHFHPLNISQMPQTASGTIYEEILYWPVGGKPLNGFISCSPMPGCFFVVRPDHDIRLGGNQVIEEGRDFDGIEFITESDDMLFLSVLPLMQYSETYRDQSPLQLLNIAKTSFDHDSLTTQRLVKAQFRFRLDDGHDAEWRKSGRQADVTMGRIIVLREYLRARAAMLQNDMARAAEMVSYALHTVRRLIAAAQADVTVFAPSDDALASLDMEKLAGLPPTHLARALADHAVAGSWRTTDFAGRKLELKSLSGRTIVVDGRQDPVSVDDAVLQKADIAAGHLVLHCVNKTLGDIVPRQSAVAGRDVEWQPAQ